MDGETGLELTPENVEAVLGEIRPYLVGTGGGELSLVAIDGPVVKVGALFLRAGGGEGPFLEGRGPLREGMAFIRGCLVGTGGGEPSLVAIDGPVVTVGGQGRGALVLGGRGPSG